MANTPGRHAEERPLDDAGIDAGPPSADDLRDPPREPDAPIGAAEDTLDDVQTYLQELFGRYGLNPSKSIEQPRPPVRPPDQKPDSNEASITPAEGPLESQFLECLPDPKRPPEQRGDILALRELSTRSARGAIAQFEAGRLVAATWARFWLCFAALGLTLFFLRAVEPFTIRTLSAAAVAMVLAVYWCGQFLLLTRQAARIGGKSVRKSAGKCRSARAT